MGDARLACPSPSPSPSPKKPGAGAGAGSFTGIDASAHRTYDALTLGRGGIDMAKRTPRMRIEKDTMGELRVPANALYGAQTARAARNFPISGLRGHPAFVDATVRVKLAAARANARLGLLPRKKARAIEAAAREVLAGRWRDQFVVDVYQAGAGTSHNMNVNDVIPTAIRLAALELAPAAIDALARLARTFDAKARRWDRVVKSGRTHLMDATPIRLGQEVSGWAVALSVAAGRVRDALPELSVLGIRGTAVRTGLNAHPRYS